jgi:hypothetical protein
LIKSSIFNSSICAQQSKGSLKFLGWSNHNVWSIKIFSENLPRGLYL